MRYGAGALRNRAGSAGDANRVCAQSPGRPLARRPRCAIVGAHTASLAEENHGPERDVRILGVREPGRERR